jgi:transposase-like protein
MAGNPHPKKRDPESARKQAKEQWANNREKMLAATRKANRIDPPDNAAEIVQKACENGCTVNQIAAALGVERRTLNRWKEEFPAIEEAFQLGRQVEHDRLVGALFDQAVNKANTTAAIFLLKARHGYVEGVPLVQNSVSVNFTLPGAMSPEQYVKTLTVEAQIVKPGGCPGSSGKLSGGSRPIRVGSG